MRRSTIILSTVLSVVVLAAGGGGFCLWQKYQSALDDNAELQSEITVLRNGGGASGGLQGASGTGTLGASTTASSPGSSPASGSADSSSSLKTMLVKDFGIKFQVPADLTDLTYAENPPASGFLALTTASLEKAYPDCAGAGILGALFRYPKGSALPAASAAAHPQPLPTVGSYDYYYVPLAKNPCTAKAALSAVSSSTAEITAALKTLTQQ